MNESPNLLSLLKESLWQQFGASIDMLENAITLWPEERWETDRRYFYITFHTLIFLEYYQTEQPSEFSPILQFTPTEKAHIPTDAVDDLIPDRTYARSELLAHLRDLRQQVRDLILGVTEQKLSSRWVEKDGDMDYARLEILLYNMRHTQHHVGQLYQLLRQKTNQHAPWEFRADE